MFFGFSLVKLIFTILVVVIIWHGFKFIGRLQDRNIRAWKKESLKRKAETNSGKGSAPDKAENMIECPVCATFVVASRAASCEREDCPY